MTRPLNYDNRVEIEVSPKAVQPIIDAAARKLEEAAAEIIDLRIAKAQLEQEVHWPKERVASGEQGRAAAEAEIKKLNERLLKLRGVIDAAAPIVKTVAAWQKCDCGEQDCKHYTALLELHPPSTTWKW
jgi:chromosome segregation ATPase